MYVRIKASNLTIINSSFLMLKFKFARFYYVSISYALNLLTMQNSIFKGNFPILSPYSMEFLQLQALFFSNITIQNIFSSSGATIRVYLLKLRNLLIQNSYFHNNSGVSNNGADFILQISDYEGFDWTNLSSEFNYSFGIMNCSFQGTKVSGSITLLDQGEMILYNSTFKNIEGMDGAILNAGSRSNVLIWGINVSNAYGSGVGGCFSFSQSHFVLISSNFYNTSSVQSGGVMVATKQSLVIIKNSNFQLSKSNEGGTLTVENTKIMLENNVFLNSEATFQGGFFYLVKSEILIRNVSLTMGKGLTGSGIHAELAVIDFYDFLIENCSSSLDKGLGALYVNGVYGQNSSITRFVCKGNQAMSGSCIYAKDIVLSLSYGEIISNYVGKESLIVIFQASLYTELNMNMVEFTGNIAGLSVILSELCSIHFQNIILNENMIITYIIYLKESSVFLSNITTLSSTSLNGNASMYLLNIENSPNSILENLYLFGEKKIGILNIQDCDFISINQSLFFDGRSNNGGGISSSNCILEISNTNFSCNSADVSGAAIFINGAPNTTIVNCSFHFNLAGDRGTDIFIEDPTHSDFTYCEFVGKDIIFSHSFFYSV